ncbi:MAG: hypothetical protein HY270_22020, partial [Deltaproteobacteria bacterium]|nr:hypothetical protein [Deltaproteobacteria bacterium]
PRLAAAPTTDAAYDALIACITHSTDGDLASGLTFDWILRVFQRSVGTGAVAPKAKPGPADLDPRTLVHFDGSMMTQIGTVNSGLDAAGDSTTPGALSVFGLASCTGNGRPSCLNNADCGRAADGTTPGVCVPNLPTTCPSGAACRGLTGTQPLKTNGVDGATLSLTPGCSGSIATCIRTVAKSAGNGTAASGGIDFSTGELFETLPLAYEVYVTSTSADCATFDPCPVCSAGKCSTGARSGRPCAAAAGSVTIECPPSLPQASTIFNPVVLSTEPKSMIASPMGAFCGFCDTSAVQNGTCDGGFATCATGCAFSQSTGVGGDAECVAKLGPGHFCDFGASKRGFNGDDTVTVISNDGVRSQYAPLLTGLSCDGISGSMVIDNAAGLPGPVRTRLSYANAYVFSKDK